ncbi:hypothetical protein [Ureibacillus manganicus]|uniref:hypothetical protein n=1 Tax=Ureibacillus manganicus TaxID=1266064 RepID=UPI002E2350CB
MKIDVTAVILKILGDKTRLTMIKMRKLMITMYVSLLKYLMSQSAISQLVRKLKDAGFVCGTRDIGLFIH